MRLGELTSDAPDLDGSRTFSQVGYQGNALHDYWTLSVTLGPLAVDILTMTCLTISFPPQL